MSKIKFALVQTEKTYNIEFQGLHYTATVFFDNVSDECWVDAYNDLGEYDEDASIALEKVLPTLEHFSICCN
jgi:hypothetical protein